MSKAERVLDRVTTCLLAPMYEEQTGRFLPQLTELGAQPAVDTLQSGELLILRNIPASPEGSPGALYFFQNVGGLGGPQVRLGFLIVAVNIVMDGLLQFVHL